MCKQVGGIGMSMPEAGCCEDTKVSGSSSDGEHRQEQEQGLRESSQHSWFLQQLVPRTEHAVELGVHKRSRRRAGGQEQVLQPGHTDIVRSASGAEEAAWVGAAFEPAAARMVQRTDEQGLASTEAVQRQPAELQGAERRPEGGMQAEGIPCRVQMDGETREQPQEMRGWQYWPIFRGLQLQRRGGLQPDEIGKRQEWPNVCHDPSSRRSPCPSRVYACELHV